MSATRGWYWPWLVTAALLFTVGVNVAMLVAVSRDPNGSVVEPDYYRKAVAWDQTMARQSASDGLGWRASAVLRRTAADSGAIEVRAVGRDGAPIIGARVVATLIHNRDAANPIRVALQEGAPGRYGAPVLLAHRGLWEVRVDARRDTDRFLATVHTDVAP